MKTKAIIPLAIGLAVGLVAVKYTLDTVNAAQGSGAPTGLLTVVMAGQDIPSCAAIAPNMLTVAQTPKTSLLPDTVFAKVEDLAGRVALKSIPRGAPILPSMLAPKGTGTGLLARVKEGYRGVAVKIDESSGVGYLVRPNDWVDVLAVMEVTRFGKRGMESRLVLERVQVGAVGQILNDSPEEGSSGKHAKTVTLLVKVEDVPKLHLAQTKGRITLAMRGYDDTEATAAAKTSKPKPSALSGLFAKMWKAGARRPEAQVLLPPSRAEPEPFTVTVINSSSTSDSAEATQHVTYSDDSSMEVTQVEKGSAPSRRISRRGASAESGANSYRPRHSEDKDRTDNSGPSEETE